MRVMQTTWAWTWAGLLGVSMTLFWIWPKFFHEFHPVFGWAEAQSGLGWLDPVGKTATGLLALASVLMLVVGRTRLAGAWLALALSAAYLIFHLTPWVGVSLPDYGPMAQVLGSGGTAADVLALGLKGDGGMWFAVALTNAVLAVALIPAETARRKPRAPRTAAYADA